MQNLIMAGLIFIILLPLLYIWQPVFALIFLFIGIVLSRIYYPKIKGIVGEAYVNRYLSKLGTNYTLFHDLYVPNQDGGTTQVDHVVTSPFGVFVIETKHYDGWIFGSEKQQHWTQTIYRRKEKFYNPIWQNYGHIQALKSYFNGFNSIYSIIAFSQNSTLKLKGEFKSARVVQFHELPKTIKEWKTSIISNSDLEEINRLLDKLTVEDKREKRQVEKQHVQAIRENQKEKKQQEKDDICPKCGGELSLKVGKYGVFMGCSNYPKCNFTKKVT